MLKVRIIPTLLLKGFGLVKGTQFDSWRRVGPVLPAVKVYNNREVDELIVVDIAAHESVDDVDYETVEDFTQDCFIPITVGGGIVEVQQVQKLLYAGADKICVNTSSFTSPKLVGQIAKLYGSQSVVASIDVKKIGDSWRCFSHAGRKDTGYEVKEWAREMYDRGAGEILLTSIDRDGTYKGYDLPLIETVVQAVNMPVIASGGAGNYQDMIDAVLKAGASAVAAASIFHFTEQTPAEAKIAMHNAGIPIRQNYAGAI